MGSAGSKAQTSEGGTTASTTSSKSQTTTVSRTDEAIGMIIDGIVLYGMFLSAKYLYAVRTCVRAPVDTVCERTWLEC